MTVESLLAILGMALVSYGVKPAGVLLGNRFPTHGFAAAWLRQVPGAVLASLIAPAVIVGGASDAVAAVATGLVMVVTRNLFAAIAAGVAVVYLARTFLAL